ncbi:MAG: hypothetical protein AABY07_11160 [Nanoarchaeota archaeon]
MKAKENKSLFLQSLGDTPQLRVLDFLIDNHFFDFPMTEIARGSNVSYNSLKAFFSALIKFNVLCKTRRIGKSDYYKIDLNNDFVKSLIRLDWVLSKNKILLENRKIAKNKLIKV